MRLFQFCHWWVDTQRNILVDKGLQLLRVEGHRMDVAAWLRGLGLEQYVQLFRDNDIDGEIQTRAAIREWLANTAPR